MFGPMSSHFIFRILMRFLLSHFHQTYQITVLRYFYIMKSCQCFCMFWNPPNNAINILKENFLKKILSEESTHFYFHHQSIYKTCNLIPSNSTYIFLKKKNFGEKKRFRLQIRILPKTRDQRDNRRTVRRHVEEKGAGIIDREKCFTYFPVVYRRTMNPATRARGQKWRTERNGPHYFARGGNNGTFDACERKRLYFPLFHVTYIPVILYTNMRHSFLHMLLCSKILDIFPGRGPLKVQ